MPFTSNCLPLKGDERHRTNREERLVFPEQGKHLARNILDRSCPRTAR